MNRDDVIAYLLHRLPEEARTAFAQRWMTEPELHAEVRAVEAELLDGYVRGTLAREDARAVEQYLLGSDAQRQKLTFARALHEALPSGRRLRLPVAWLAAAAAIAALAVTAGYYAREASRLRATVAQMAQPPAPTGGVYAFAVPLGATRGAASGASPRLHVPSGVAVVRLDLELESGETATTVSASLTKGTASVWTGTAPVVQRGAARVAECWIPAGFVSPGAYEIGLAAGGRAIAYYTLTVIP